MGLWSFHHPPVKQSSSKLARSSSILLGFLLCCFAVTTTVAYDLLDPMGNITIKWDVLQWTPDGYVAVVSIFNFQKYRHIEAPGWRLGWTWAREEVIWSMLGAHATEQGDCSRYRGNIPLSCKKNPTVVDWQPGTPSDIQIANCCRGGVLNSWAQDPATAVSSFQLSVGVAGTSNRTVAIPHNFTLQAPEPGYSCGATRIVKPTRFLSQDGRRMTQALMTWQVVCSYSQILFKKTPTCCVSLSSFYNDTITKCPTCSCSCQDRTRPGSCVKQDSAISKATKNSAPMVQCTNHMCPIQVHWHVKLNYKDYWRVKITITNLNHGKNYSSWNLLVEHPNFANLKKVYSFNYKSPDHDRAINDTAMFWGIKFHNDLLMQAGPSGHVQSDLLFRKVPRTFTFAQGWAFPRRVSFNGDICVMPPPKSYP